MSESSDKISQNPPRMQMVSLDEEIVRKQQATRDIQMERIKQDFQKQLVAIDSFQDTSLGNVSRLTVCFSKLVYDVLYVF